MKLKISSEAENFIQKSKNPLKETSEKLKIYDSKN